MLALLEVACPLAAFGGSMRPWSYMNPAMRREGCHGKPLISVAPTGNKLVPSPNPNP